MHENQTVKCCKILNAFKIYLNITYLKKKKYKHPLCESKLNTKGAVANLIFRNQAAKLELETSPYNLPQKNPNSQEDVNFFFFFLLVRLRMRRLIIEIKTEADEQNKTKMMGTSRFSKP